VLADMIAERLRCDVHRIRAAEPYSDDYDETVTRNVREQAADARPAIANALPSIGSYDVVLLASPLWNVRPPMIMRTFAERYDFTGKTVLPMTTYAVSGLGTAADEYADACEGATIGRGLTVRGERVRDAGDDIDSWLRRIRLERAG
jgi:flavodoxin